MEAPPSLVTNPKNEFPLTVEKNDKTSNSQVTDDDDDDDDDGLNAIIPCDAPSFQNHESTSLGDNIFPCVSQSLLDTVKKNALHEDCSRILLDDSQDIVNKEKLESMYNENIDSDLFFPSTNSANSLKCTLLPDSQKVDILQETENICKNTLPVNQCNSNSNKMALNGKGINNTSHTNNDFSRRNNRDSNNIWLDNNHCFNSANDSNSNKNNSNLLHNNKAYKNLSPKNCDEENNSSIPENLSEKNSSKNVVVCPPVTTNSVENVFKNALHEKELSPEDLNKDNFFSAEDVTADDSLNAESLTEDNSLPANDLTEDNTLPSEDFTKVNPLPAERLTEENSVSAESPSEDESLPTESLTEDNPLPSERLTEENSVPAEHLTEDDSLTAESLTEDNPLPAERPTEENYVAVEHLTEEDSLQAECLTEDNPLPAERLTEENSVPAEHLTEDDSLPAESLTEDNPLPAERLTEKNSVPAEHLTEDNSLPAERLTEDNYLPAERLTEDNSLPAESLTEDNPLPAERLTEENSVPAEHLTEDNSLPAERLTEDNYLLAERLTEDNSLPAESLTEDNPLPAERLTEENSVPAEHLTEDNSLPAERLTEDNYLPAERLTEDNPLPAKRLTDENYVFAEHLTEDNSLPAERLTEDHSLLAERLTEDNSLPAESLTEENPSSSGKECKSNIAENISSKENINHTEIELPQNKESSKHLNVGLQNNIIGKEQYLELIESNNGNCVEIPETCSLLHNLTSEVKANKSIDNSNTAEKIQESEAVGGVEHLQNKEKISLNIGIDVIHHNQGNMVSSVENLNQDKISGKTSAIDKQSDNNCVENKSLNCNQICPKVEVTNSDTKAKEQGNLNSVEASSASDLAQLDCKKSGIQYNVSDSFALNVVENNSENAAEGYCCDTRTVVELKSDTKKLDKNLYNPSDDFKQNNKIDSCVESNFVTNQIQSDVIKVISPKKLFSSKKLTSECEGSESESSQEIEKIPGAKTKNKISTGTTLLPCESDNSTNFKMNTTNHLSHFSTSYSKEFIIQPCSVNLSKSRVVGNSVVDDFFNASTPHFNKLKRKLEDMLYCAQNEEQNALTELKRMRQEKSSVLKDLQQEIQKVKSKFQIK